MSPSSNPPRAFVSYAHEAKEPEKSAHAARVTALVEYLRDNEIDAHFDREVHGTPPQGWPAWMEEQLREANFVLVVCTETYLRRYNVQEKSGQGKGAIWEGGIIRQELYDAAGQNKKFAAILFAASDEAFKPAPLRQHTHYRDREDREALLRWLTDQPAYIPKPLGKKPNLPPNP
jgi:hypothetical protein